MNRLYNKYINKNNTLYFSCEHFNQYCKVMIALLLLTTFQLQLLNYIV